MIEKVEMYQAVCDRCGESYYDEFNGFVAWSDKCTAKDAAINGGEWHEIDGKLYCPNCIEYDNEIDDYKPKERK